MAIKVYWYLWSQYEGRKSRGVKSMTFREIHLAKVLRLRGERRTAFLTM